MQMDLNGDVLLPTEHVEKLAKPAVLSDECSKPGRSSLSSLSGGCSSPDVNGITTDDEVSTECLNENQVDPNHSESSASDFEKLDVECDEDALNSNSNRNVEASNCEGEDEVQDDIDKDGWVFVLGHDQLKKRVSVFTAGDLFVLRLGYKVI
jgi:hypothetical protein